jgi:hypothetical protein
VRHRITTQRQLRREFRQTFPKLDLRLIPDCSRKGTMHKTDARCAWVDWIDGLSKDGEISQALAERATL